MSNEHKQHAGHEHEHEIEREVHTEVVHVPKGKSPWAFIILVGMLILMLVSFSITGSMWNLFDRRRAKDEVASWVRPGHGRESIGNGEFIILKRQMDTMQRRSGRNEQRVQNRDVLADMVLYKLAQDAGVTIPDAELAELLAQVRGQGSIEQYKAMASQFEGGVPGFEAFMRQLLTVNRYVDLMAHLVAAPDPAKVEELWKADRQELSVEYVALEKSKLVEEARAALPDDAALQGWLDQQPDFDKEEYRTKAKAKVELAGFRVGGSAPAALLAKYPPKEGADAEQAAKDYYNAVFYMRFKRATQLPPDPSKPNDLRNQIYMSYEEAAEQARAEAPIFNALTAWRAEVEQRLAGTPAKDGAPEVPAQSVDLAAEASALGLTYFASEQALTQQEWGQNTEWDTQLLSYQFLNGQPGKLLNSVSATGKALLVARVLAKEEAQLKPLAEIKDQVAQKWIDKHSAELALAKLQALYDGFKPAPPALDTGKIVATADAFAAAAKAAGLEVQRREAFDRQRPAAQDPEGTAGISQFLRDQAAIASLEPDQLAAPALARSGDAAYLVRLVSKNPTDIAKMTPADLQGLEMRARYMQQSEFVKSLRSIDALKKAYGLDTQDLPLD